MAKIYKIQVTDKELETIVKSLRITVSSIIKEKAKKKNQKGFFDVGALKFNLESANEFLKDAREIKDDLEVAFGI